MHYITPTRYRSLPTGIALTGKTDADLQALLEASAVAVNAACHAPEGYSFLGGSVVGEEHNWDVGNAYRRGSGRVWPYMRPIKSVDSVQINVTRTQYVSFTDAQIFLQKELGYVEPVAAPNTTALFTSVPPWLLTSPVAYVDYAYGFDFPVTDETLTSISGGILQAAHQFWYTDEDVVLKKNGTVVPSVDYEINYEEGWITPDTAPAGEVYKASYHYRVPAGVAAASSMITTDLIAYAALAAQGMLGLSAIRVEEVELRQSAKVNFAVQPISVAAQIYLGPYAAMFVSMR